MGNIDHLQRADGIVVVPRWSHVMVPLMVVATGPRQMIVMVVVVNQFGILADHGAALVGLLVLVQVYRYFIIVSNKTVFSVVRNGIKYLKVESMDSGVVAQDHLGPFQPIVIVQHYRFNWSIRLARLFRMVTGIERQVDHSLIAQRAQQSNLIRLDEQERCKELVSTECVVIIVMACALLAVDGGGGGGHCRIDPLQMDLEGKVSAGKEMGEKTRGEQGLLTVDKHSNQNSSNRESKTSRDEINLHSSSSPSPPPPKRDVESTLSF